MPISGCHEPKQLADWLLGKLSDQEALRIREHVERCPACEQVAMAAESKVDPLIANLREPLSDGLHEDEPECGRLLADLESMQLTPADGPVDRGAIDLRDIREYRLIAQLGAGGIGVVYKAVHSKLQKTVALKVLSLGLEKRVDAIQRFLREMEAVGRLDHPHIVRAIDAGEFEGRLYLAMEFVDGVDLHRLVKSHGPLCIAAGCEAVRQAASGLQYAHGQGIIHRDVKPANLMIDGSGLIKIVDLGLARFERPAGPETDDAALTRGGAPIGTYDYMAPEQATEPQHTGPPADIYSLGCTLYYLLTGRPVYGGDTEIQRLFAHREDPIPELSNACPDAPAQLDAIFRKMVAKQAADRYQRMSDVIADLDACGVCRRDNAQSPRAAAIGGLAGLIEAIPQQDPASPSKRIEEGAPRRERRHEEPSLRRRLRAAGLIAAALATIGLGVAAVDAVITRPRLTIESEVDDLLRLEVTKNGKSVEIVDVYAGSTDRRLWPGKYELKLVPNPNGVELSTRSVSLQRGENVVITATEPVTAGESFEPGVYQEQQAKESAVALDVTNGIGMKLVFIPRGTFCMGTGVKVRELLEDRIRQAGAPQEFIELLNGEKRHVVELTEPYYMSIHEVTQEEYERVMHANPSHFAPQGKGAGLLAGVDHRRLPVENVSFIEAATFCNKLSELEGLEAYYDIDQDKVDWKEGNGYRLPTEAEWEWACRAGNEEIYHFGNNQDKLDEYAYYLVNSNQRPHPVGELEKNGFGLFDMHGNVWEWCWDFYQKDYYATLLRTDPKGPPTGRQRTLRGGSFDNGPYVCRSAVRVGAPVRVMSTNDEPASIRSPRRGFRIVGDVREIYRRCEN